MILALNGESFLQTAHHPFVILLGACLELLLRGIGKKGIDQSQHQRWAMLAREQA